MSAFDLLSGASVRKPYLGFSNLRIGHYEVVKFKLVKNKLYNPNAEKPLAKLVLMVELKDQVLFLPQYFATSINLDEEKVAELNGGEKKFMFFGGKGPNK